MAKLLQELRRNKVQTGRESAGRVRAGSHGTRRTVRCWNKRTSQQPPCRLLRLSGHEVEAAYSALTALEVAHRFRPDAIVLDVGLPHLDGCEVARRLRANPTTREALIVGLTGYGEAGFDEYRIKPADPERLEQLLSASSAAGR